MTDYPATDWMSVVMMQRDRCFVERTTDPEASAANANHVRTGLLFFYSSRNDLKSSLFAKVCMSPSSQMKAQKETLSPPVE